ncbi:MAG: molecular chaperone TorD family protein [Coriobacteriales bacterium]|nr:molecular chaperone TorD family protein [Coriobacteriales bacterium]
MDPVQEVKEQTVSGENEPVISPEEAEAVSAVFESHRAFYGLLSRLYYSPLTQEEIDRLKTTLSDYNFDADADDDASKLLHDGLHMMRTELRSIDHDLRLDFNVDYTSAFYGIARYEKQVATPYESIFRGERRELYGEARDDVFSAMKHDRLKLKEGIDLPEDHLSFELQYLAILCERGKESMASGDYEEVLKNVKKQRAFIAEHILSWIDDLAKVANKVLEYDFYRGVLMATKGFLVLADEELASVEEALEQ